MSSRRHRRTPPVRFEIVVAVLVVVIVASIAWGATRDDDGGPRAATPSPPAPSAKVRPSRATSPAASPSGSSPSPAASPSGSSPSPAGDREPLLIHATGDVSLDPSYIPAFRTNGYAWAWTGMDGLFEHDDLTIVNHECPSTTIVAPVPKEFNFRCDPAALPVAKRYGVDVMSLANNHGYDQGPQGLLDSIRNIEDAGMVALGAGKDAEAADAPRYFDVKGWRIGLVGVDEVLDPLDEVATADKPGTAVGHDFSRALASIREADANADLVIVMLHWGVELDTRPRDYQVAEAHRMIAAGADILFGSHAHRLQPMDTYQGHPIFYGLGNFVWPNFSVEGSTTAVAEVTVARDGEIRGRLLPAFISAPGHPILR